MGKEILTKNQGKVLEILSRERGLTGNFYLTGGTALAAFYLNHRYSEDLDFFSEKEIQNSQVIAILKKLKPKLKFQKLDLQPTLNRNIIFFHFPREILKTEFTYFPFQLLNKGKMFNELKIDSISDIAANKLFTIYQKPRARDFIDLYLILKKKRLSFDNLIKNARLKFDWHIDPLTLGTQFMKVKEVIDYPRMVKKIDNKIWQDYFIKIADKLKGKIF